MVDSIDVQPGTRNGRKAVATDEIGNVHYPIYKLSVGALGTQTPVDSDNPLPVVPDNTSLIAAQLETSNEMLSLLNDVLDELRIMNTYNALAHNQELTKEDAE
ncbi:MAG: hypothetical protein ABFS03_00885 [Chloroflexota bacterium]